MIDCLVTGGTGFIGSALVRHLIGKGLSVRVFDNNFRGKTSNLEGISKQVEIVERNILDKEAVFEATKNVKEVFHLAFINGTRYFYEKPELVLEVGVKGTLNVIDAVKELRPEKFIFASSSEIYQQPEVIPTPEDVKAVIPDVHNPRYSYGGGKLIGELLTLHSLKKEDCRRIIFRPHNVYGPVMGWEHAIPEIVKKIYHASNRFTKDKAEITIIGTGDETRAFCYVDDAVEGIYLASEKGDDGDIFHVGTDHETRIIDMIETVGEKLGVKLTFKYDLTSHKGGTSRRCPDITKLKSLGYNPKFALDEGLKHTVAWYKEALLGENNG